MRENNETGKAHPHKKLGIVPTALTVLGLTFAGQAGLSHINDNRQHEANAEEAEVLNGHDSDLRTLAQMNRAVLKNFPDLRSVDYKSTGIITIDGKTFETGTSEYGDVLKYREKIFMVGNLENAIENVEAVRRAEEKTE